MPNAKGKITASQAAQQLYGSKDGRSLAILLHPLFLDSGPFMYIICVYIYVYIYIYVCNKWTTI